MVPGWDLIQVTTFDNNSVTTNWRSASVRCEIVTTAQRGRPSAVNSSDAMSSSTPSIHAANDGLAMRPFSVSASFMRSAAG